jgi:hypothetical protein
MRDLRLFDVPSEGAIDQINEYIDEIIKSLPAIKRIFARPIIHLKDVYELLLTRNPLSLKVITLLDKPSRRLVDFKADLALFTIPDHFVIGYGLDCGEFYRNLPYIAEYSEE